MHEDDLIAFIEPSLAAASVPAQTVNWCGDVAFNWREAIDYMGELVCERPVYGIADARAPASVAGDPERRMAITGPCKVHWREGVRRLVAFWEPRIRNGRSAYADRPLLHAGADA